MTGPIQIEVDDRQFQAAFRELTKRAIDMTPLMADIAETLTESTQRRFQTGTDPDGIPWPALKDGSGRKPLNLTGTMRDQIYPTHGKDWAQVNASAKQARWHQEGTDPYTILPRDKKALFWPGGPGPRARVDHPGLPARPFMGVSDEDACQILALAEFYLEEAAGAR